VQPRIHAPLLLAAAFFAASCGKGASVPTSFTQPTGISTESSVLVSATSPVPAGLLVSNPLCPSVPPFNVPLLIVVQPNGPVAVVVTQIRLAFDDTSGIRMPQVKLPAPKRKTEIGTALAASRSAQDFAVTLGLGCGTGLTGNVAIFVDTLDANGRSGMGQATFSVR
jgi:hypothetical protein